MIFGSVLQGFKGFAVMVEVDLKRGIPNTVVTGLPRGALLESVDRIRTSIRNSGFTYPYERVLVNLSPAGIIKSGTSFDVAIACSILEKMGVLFTDKHSILAIGELQLSGKVLPVEGILNAILSLKDQMDYILVPPKTVKNCFPDNPQIIEVDSLIEAITVINHLNSPIENDLPHFSEPKSLPDSSIDEYSSISTINYQISEASLKNCCLSTEILGGVLLSAASGLHTFLFGPPGTGKSFCGDLLYALLPENNEETAFMVSRIHSAAGFYGENGIIAYPPYRHPHHSASIEGVIGGGKESAPGEVTLAHGGLLFLDEAPEFKPSILQALREPMESGSVSISRVGKKWHYPADFQTLLSANLCPCGEYGRYGSLCICSIRDMICYWNRIGGALFDRIPIRIPFPVGNVTQKNTPFDLNYLQQKVKTVRERLKKAFPRMPLRHVSPSDLLEKFPFTETIQQEIEEEAQKYRFSVRQKNDLYRLVLTATLLQEKPTPEKEEIEMSLSVMLAGSSPMDIEIDRKKALISNLLLINRI